MHRARDVAEFLADPRGRYLAGHSFVVWVHNETLAGSAYFGLPDTRDFPTLMSLYDLALHPRLATPFDAVVDCGRLTSLELSAFGILTEHLTTMPRLTSRVRRASIVRPPGMIGATVAGLFYEKVHPLFPAAMFTDRREAFRWLERPDGNQERDAIETMMAEVSGEAQLVRQLRDLLLAQEGALSMGRAAQVIGTSERSLQRRLAELGTSFRAEVARARVQAAEVLLLDSELKLEAIARQVGCASLAHFSSMFRRATGEAPSDFRARRRPATGSSATG